MGRPYTVEPCITHSIK